MENKKSKLEILIIDDLEENRNAARIGLRDIAEITFATNYAEAMKKLEEKSYAAAIVDLNFPRNEGEGPQKIGFELEQYLETINGKYRIPHIYLTNFMHGEKSQSMIYLDEKTNWGSTSTDKSTPGAWTSAFEKLTKLYDNLEEIFESKQRWKEAIGTNYVNPAFKEKK